MLRATLLLAVLVVVALAVVLATRPDDAVLVPDVIDVHAQGETPASEAAVKGGRLTAPEREWTHTRPLDALRADLRSPRHALKKRALDEIIEKPALGRPLRPWIETCLEGGDRHGVHVRARVALMKIERHRRWWPKLAEEKTPYWLLQLDPVHGAAFHTAVQQVRYEGDGQAAAASIADALERDPRTGVERLVGELAGAQGDLFATLLQIAIRLRPVPVGVGTLLVSRLDDAMAAGRLDPVWQALCRERVLWGDAGCVVARAVVERWASLPITLTGEAEIALGRLGCAEPGILEHLVGRFRETTSSHALASLEALSHALASLEALGREAGSAVPALLALAPGLPESRRVGFLQALLACGGPEIVPYLADRLIRGAAAEQDVILRRLTEVEGAEALVEVLADEVRRRGDARALRALVQIDPECRQPETERALGDALSSSRWQVRVEALSSVALRLSRLPDAIVPAVIRGLDSDRPAVATAAVQAVGELGRYGAPARAWLADLLAYEATGEARTRPELARSLYGTLGEIGGDDSRVRALLFHELERRTRGRVMRDCTRPEWRALTGILWGLQGIGTPTAEEYRAVAGCMGCTHLIGAALDVLGIPAWETVRQAAGIQTVMRPKIREPRWTHPRFR